MFSPMVYVVDCLIFYIVGMYAECKVRMRPTNLHFISFASFEFRRSHAQGGAADYISIVFIDQCALRKMNCLTDCRSAV